ncbi:MGH1-like glycoside hydrolase domain-containing protein [Catalinimonas alkaloidigena]|uniref:alpha-L-rhamnosidase-related protein n=1 Tax=Catalinimonas alkaloidigena TaxID=1075417 RepID=UPI001FE14CF6|nr:trehalase family glycosidase [Catalinimonas alkaloidigena]
MSCQTQSPPRQPQGPLWQSDVFSVFPDRVVQGPYVARVLSPTELSSNYQSPANAFVSPQIQFKFSLNGKDNEMKPGQDHQFHCVSQNGVCQPPLIRFGEQYVDTSDIPPGTYLRPNTELHLRLDLRHVLRSFEEKGFFETYDGEKLYKEDFKGVFVAGSTAPLVWDFDNLTAFPELELHDPDGDGIYDVTLTMNAPQDQKTTASHWSLSKDISAFPRYYGNYPLVEALYNLSLEEMLTDIEADGTFRTGAEWAGVWTRDISYSILLSMALLQPKVARTSLMRKVKEGRIIQDTGTGGAYPVSTDRIVWAVAAWEIYVVTGDEDWLREAYPIIRKSIDEDVRNAYDPATGLVRGESSFLDWREQTYPAWMQPADIYESLNLGTNAVHYRANLILAEMATRLGNTAEAEHYRQVAGKIREGLDRYLWQEERGYYGQFLYGRHYKLLSPRAEALGEALCVLFEVADADRQQTLVARTPVTNFGIPCIYPQIPHIPPYHNNGIWPFVQAYWSLAAAKAGNETALTQSLNAIYRPAALFLTNKENFVASTGDFAGTQINSSRMLWSLSGNLSMVYRIFFGMHFESERLVLAPFVPERFAGTHTLENFAYRNAVLTLTVEGYGNRIEAITLDEEALEQPVLPATLEGKHTVKIVLSNQSVGGEVHHVPDRDSPAAPVVELKNGELHWDAQPGVTEYWVLKNGQEVARTEKPFFALPEETDVAEYQVLAVDGEGVASFGSEPVVLPRHVQRYEAEQAAVPASHPYKGFSGSGFVEISQQTHTDLVFEVTVPEDGRYALDFRYANGNGPINTDNRCAIRTLRNGDDFLGTVVLPQRGADEWSEWGFTNAIPAELPKGTHQLHLRFEPHNANMHGEVNQAMIDFLRVTRLP